MDNRGRVINWLRDAYAMERATEKILKNHVEDAKDFPEMRRRLDQHLSETRLQAERIERCLEDLGEKTSAAKSVMGQVVGTMNGAMTGMYQDEIVRNILADYATEHFEIACYKSLIAGATQAGMDAVIAVAEENLREEEAMAEWLSGQISPATVRFLNEEREQVA